MYCENTTMSQHLHNPICRPDCDTGWMKYNGHCYFRNTTKMSQREAMVIVIDK